MYRIKLIVERHDGQRWRPTRHSFGSKPEEESGRLAIVAKSIAAAQGIHPNTYAHKGNLHERSQTQPD